MSASGHEKRAFPRVYFNGDEVVTGSFGPLDQPDILVRARVLNLSMGGLYITVDRDAGVRFRPNETIIMYEMNTPEGLLVSSNVMVDVRRVEDQPVFDHVGYGCRFIGLERPAMDRLEKFLRWQLNGLKTR